jgi:hypothetical protein
MRRTPLAGLLGALAIFMWMFVAHSLTTIAMTGIQQDIVGYVCVGIVAALVMKNAEPMYRSASA